MECKSLCVEALHQANKRFQIDKPAVTCLSQVELHAIACITRVIAKWTISEIYDVKIW